MISEDKLFGKECIAQITDGVNTITSYFPKDWGVRFLKGALINAAKALKEEGKKERKILLSMTPIEDYLKIEAEGEQIPAKWTVDTLRDAYIQKYMNDDETVDIIKV